MTSVSECPDELEWLQRWFSSRCDGQWEHEKGVGIETVDNPGWRVIIDIDKEGFAGGDGVLVSIGDPPRDANRNVGGPVWMICQVRGSQFVGAGDAGKLAAIIRCFREKVARKARPDSSWRGSSGRRR
jgi:hypothetical protein